MRHCARVAMPSYPSQQIIPNNGTVASIKGTVKKLGGQYSDAMILLFNKSNYQLIAATQPKDDGSYKFLGLHDGLKTFVVAFDKKQQFNAVIQDNVVPK